MRKDEKDLQEKLLLKCDNDIHANEIIALLDNQGIAFRIHDERQDPQTGAYGPITGIAIYVFEKDYQRAMEVIAPVAKERKEVHPFCPKCGSENVSIIDRRHNYGSAIGISCLFLFLVPGIYLSMANHLDFRSATTDVIALLMFVAGLVVLVAGRNLTANYRCDDCGKKFRHV